MSGRGAAAVLAVAILAVGGCGSGRANDAIRPAGGSQPGTAITPAPGARTTPVVPDATRPVTAAELPPCPRRPEWGRTSGGEPRGLPALTLPCLGQGPRLTLSALRGRPLVVNVWAPWCVPCREEMPILSAVATRAGERVQFLGVSILADADSSRIGAKALGMRFPSVLDEDGAIRAPLRVFGPPQTFFVRSDGGLAYVSRGPLRSERQLATLLQQHLGVLL